MQLSILAPSLPVWGISRVYRVYWLGIPPKINGEDLDEGRDSTWVHAQLYKVLVRAIFNINMSIVCIGIDMYVLCTSSYIILQFFCTCSQKKHMVQVGIWVRPGVVKFDSLTFPTFSPPIPYRGLGGGA